MKKQIALLFFLSILFAPKKTIIHFECQLPQETSQIPIEENIENRNTYWQKVLASPVDGKIPDDIIIKEKVFSDKIPLRKNTSNSRQEELEWTVAGPYNVGGRTRGLVLDVTNEKVIVAGGVSGSVWKSNNEGISWTRTSSPEIRNSVSCIAQDTRIGKEDIWYFGTGELVGNSARSQGAPYRGDGLFKSTDNAESWYPLTSTTASNPDRFSSQFQYIWNIVPNTQKYGIDEVYIAAYGGILRSQDGGDSWEAILGEKLFDLPEDANLNTSVAPFYTSIRQTEKGYFLATLSSATSSIGNQYSEAGMYFSETGDIWHQIQNRNFPSYHERTVIGVDEENDIFYFFSQADRVELHAYQLSSITTGRPFGTWTDLTDNLPPESSGIEGLDTQNGYNMLIEVQPEDPQTVFLGATNLYRSNDAFQSPNQIDWIGGYQSNTARYPNHHPDQHALVFFPTNPRNMLSANDGGVRKTFNNLQDSVSWSSLNNGYISSQFYTIAQQIEKSSDNMIGGMQDNGSYLRFVAGDNPNWERTLGGDGGYSAMTNDDRIVYASFQESQIYRFILNESGSPITFTRIDPLDGGQNGEGYLFINPYVIDPSNNNRMFLLDGDEVWRNTNLSQIPHGSINRPSLNWEIINTRIGVAYYSAIQKSRSGDVLYAGFTGSQSGIIKINGASSKITEEVSTLAPSIFPGGGHISNIAIHPFDENEIIVVFSNYEVPSIFHSQDGGTTFTDVSGSLEEYDDGTGSGPSIRWAEIVPTTGGTQYFVGTSTGLYSTDLLNSSSTTWLKEASSMIGSSVITMMNYRSIDGRLIVATHGNGTFTTFIKNPLQENESPAISLAEPKAFPNPFTDVINIQYEIEQDDFIKIELYDRSGKYIKDLLWATQFAGTNTITWDGSNAAGVKVDKGIYFCKIKSSSTTETLRVLYLPD